MFLYAIVLFLIAILCQLIGGSLAMLKRINISFGWLMWANLVFTCLVAFALVQMVVPNTENTKCGMPQMAAFFLGFAAIVLQLFIMILQLFWRAMIRSK